MNVLLFFIGFNIYMYNSLNAGQTSEDIHSFNATDLFHVAKDGHTWEM